MQGCQVGDGGWLFDGMLVGVGCGREGETLSGRINRVEDEGTLVWSLKRDKGGHQDPLSSILQTRMAAELVVRCCGQGES